MTSNAVLEFESPRRIVHAARTALHAASTEASNQPDFIFPCEREYHDATFNAALLVMLGVKSTSKDRWRQVLTEADRTKTTPHPPARRQEACAPHLIRPAATFSPARRRNLEAGISAKQTDEMRRQQLTLVVPTGLHATYTAAQLAGILSVAEFVEFVRRKQA